MSLSEFPFPNNCFSDCSEMDKMPAQAREWQEIADIASSSNGQHLTRGAEQKRLVLQDKDSLASGKAQKLCISRKAPFTSLV